ncbi:hypothetical protein [Verrucomicrobium sp. BvORR034]|uniref:hypothetical protein n=1 Tax=Verrucomicrobium sp. BvORR034 TaxID=1396418 RepID=UPI000678A2C1|nr:hypothetical protein [Verrucomicrobium sp. BvORR034]
MKAIAASIILFALSLGTAEVKADGYPYNSSTQEVFVGTVRIRLSAAQQLEIAKSGELKPDATQRTFLLTVYPNLPEQIQVLSATYNDSIEDMDDSFVNCFWVAPAEVALTLPPRAEKKVWKFAMPPEGMKPPHLRLGADGAIYESGKELDLAAALKLIETTPTLDGDAGGDRLVVITLPPPYRVSAEDAEHEYAAANRKVAEIFAKLVEHSQTHKVTLQQTW